jgi:hypothetical protein
MTVNKKINCLGADILKQLLNITVLFIWYLLASLKKNVTRQTWRVLISVWRVFEKNGFPHC